MVKYPVRFTTRGPGDVPDGVDPELWRSSPAMAVADTLLGDAHKEQDARTRTETLAQRRLVAAPPAASLADLFISSTYEWTKHFNYTAHETKLVMPILAAYRQAMRNANRFELDDEFVRYATQVSTSLTPQKLLYRLQFATLPYQTTWIEFNLKTKVAEMRRLHGLEPLTDRVAPRLGVLLERVDDTLSTVTLVSEGGWGELEVTAPNFTGYVFSLDERNLRFDRSYNGMTPFSAAYRMKKLKQMPDFADIASLPEAEEVMTRVVHGALWGYGKEGRQTAGNMIMSSCDMVEHLRVPEMLLRHGEVAFSRFYDVFEKAGRNEIASKTSASLISQEITEFTGMMRWVVAVLAMLNEVPTLTGHVRPTHQMRAGLLRRTQAMDYHRVSLKLPKTKPLAFIEKHLSNVERRHKAHEVRAHWRTYLQEPHCHYDEHAWEYDYNEGYRLCGRCMSFGRLIHEHVRGDESLGWVRKDYVVKREKQT